MSGTTFTNSRSGLGNVAEYQASGFPWVTSSTAPTTTPVQINFPYVTSKLYFQNRSNSTIVIGFTLNGTLGTNRYEIPASGSFPCEIRTNKLFVMSLGTAASYSLMAGLTTIFSKDYPVLTGSTTLTTASTAVTYGYAGDPGFATGLG